MQKRHDLLRESDADISKRITVYRGRAVQGPWPVCMLCISTVDQPIERVTIQALDCSYWQLHLPSPVGRGESRLVCRVVV
jgi:hypothetical protein